MFVSKKLPENLPKKSGEVKNIRSKISISVGVLDIEEKRVSDRLAKKLAELPLLKSFYNTLFIL